MLTYRVCNSFLEFSPCLSVTPFPSDCAKDEGFGTQEANVGEQGSKTVQRARKTVSRSRGEWKHAISD